MEVQSASTSYHQYWRILNIILWFLRVSRSGGGCLLLLPVDMEKNLSYRGFFLLLLLATCQKMLALFVGGPRIFFNCRWTAAVPHHQSQIKKNSVYTLTSTPHQQHHTSHLLPSDCIVLTIAVLYDTTSVTKHQLTQSSTLGSLKKRYLS